MTKKEIEKELILLAKVRWAIRREKDDYKRDFQEYIKKHPEQQDNPLIFENFKFSPDETLKEIKKRVKEKKYKLPPVNFNFQSKWKISPPVAIKVEDPNPFSLQSLMYVKRPISVLGHYRFPIDRKYHGNKKIFDFVKLGSESPIDFKRFKLCVYNMVGNLIKKDPPEHTYNLESRKIILEIDLDQHAKYIKQEFSDIVRSYQDKLAEIGLKTDRKNSPAVAANAMKVFRLHKERKTWKDIAKVIFPDDFGDQTKLKADGTQPNPVSAEIKVQQYYKKAKELIREDI